MSDEIIRFWFEELEPRQWFNGGDEVDEMIRSRFTDTHAAAKKGELFEWRSQPLGRLAEVIVLDQFSRNIHRGSPLAFAQDPMALCLAQEAVSSGDDQRLTTGQRAFLLMPFMHSESRLIQEHSVSLFRSNGVEMNTNYALQHQKIVERFGRYPHRNKILGRPSTPEELEFLQQPGSSF